MPHCGAPVKNIEGPEITLTIQCADNNPKRVGDWFHVLIDGTPIGLATYNIPFKILINKPSILTIKLKGFMQYQSDKITIDPSKISTVCYEVLFAKRPVIQELAVYKLLEMK